MITLEAEAEAPPQLAARAVAATLEDTVRRVANFGFEHFSSLDESTDQRQLLEAVATEAFFEAAMNHVPAHLLDARRLAERELYFETTGEVGIWAYRPKPRYKKYTRIFDVTLNPQNVANVGSFGTTTLRAFLAARGVQLPVKAKVHLYEAIPGTTLSRIAALERRVPGLGSGGEAARSQIHPLTTEAAGAILGQRALGRDVDPRFRESRQRITVGQRFYFLELPHAGAGPQKHRRPSEVNLTIDLRASQIRLYAFLSEADAQRIVAASPSASAATAVQLLFGLASGAVQSLRTGGLSKHVRLLREAPEAEDYWQAIAGAAGKKMQDWIIGQLIDALLNMLKAALMSYFNARLAEFAKAVRNAADGVTLVFTYNHPGLRILQVLLNGKLPSWSDVRSAARALKMPSVDVVPGFKRG
jgi:hypothetical protein